MAKSKRHPAKSTRFIVEVEKENLVVSLPGGGFTAVSVDRIWPCASAPRPTTKNCWQKHFRLLLPKRVS